MKKAICLCSALVAAVVLAGNERIIESINRLIESRKAAEVEFIESDLHGGITVTSIVWNFTATNYVATLSDGTVLTNRVPNSIQQKLDYIQKLQAH